jgi:hypothetical protein
MIRKLKPNYVIALHLVKHLPPFFDRNRFVVHFFIQLTYSSFVLDLAHVIIM